MTFPQIQLPFYTRVICFILFSEGSVGLFVLFCFQREVERSVEFLQSKNAEIESMLEYLKAQPEKVDVDDAVQATSPLYNQ